MSSDELKEENELVSQVAAVLAPTKHDAHVCKKVLDDAQIESNFFNNMDDLCHHISQGTGLAVVAQEYLKDSAYDQLRECLNRQPPWSDLPVIILTQSQDQSADTIERLLALNNSTLIDRPLRIAVFVNKVRARLRDRQRQYSLRDLLRERDRASEESRLNAMKLNIALQAGGMAAWEWTPQKCIWQSQFYDLIGIDPNLEANMELFFSRVHPEDVDNLSAKWKQATDGVNEYYEEFRIIRPDQEIRWITGVGNCVRDNRGQVVEIHGLIWDNTEQREFEKSLDDARARAIQANESKSAFLANMSHEIRTPMTAILGYIDIVAEKVQDEETLSHVRTIRRNGHFLLNIINDILDLSKIEAGKLEVSHERFSPHRVLEDVRSIMGVRAKEKDLTLEIKYEGLIPEEIYSDSKRLKQILINIIGNAIKFTSKGSVSTIVKYLEYPESILQFEIVDTGIGISPQQQMKLFQPFSQGDEKVNREFGGTGLGLAISKRLTEMLGGQITVDSELKKGSRFTLTIATGDLTGVKMIDPEKSMKVDDEDQAIEKINLNCHVLIVDDRRDVRFLSNALLKKAGAQTSEAEDGEIALQMVEAKFLKGETYDLILLDMQMPRLDGYQTAQKLREMGYEGPIIALTADAMQGDMKRCLQSGCNDYLSKPIDVNKLTSMVHKFTTCPSSKHVVE